MINEEKSFSSEDENNKIVLTVVISILITAIVFGGGVYLLQNRKIQRMNQEAQRKNMILEDKISQLEKQTGIEDEIDEIISNDSGSIDDKVIYRNSMYGFELEFPKDWGRILEKTEDRSDFQVVTLTSSVDSDYELYVYISDEALPSDTPARLISNENNYIYYSSSAEYAGMPGSDEQKFFDMEDEIDEIADSFEIIDMVNWNSVYRDTEAGFSFRYPDSLSIKTKMIPGTSGNYFGVDVEKIDEIDAPGKSSEIARNKKQALENGNYYDEKGFYDNYDVVTIGSGKNIETSISLAMYDVCSTMFLERAIFYIDDYQVTIMLNGDINSIKAQNPAYFTVDSANCGSEKIWKSRDSFCGDLLNGRIGGTAKEIDDIFAQILRTIEIK